MISVWIGTPSLTNEPSASTPYGIIDDLPCSSGCDTRSKRRLGGTWAQLLPRTIAVLLMDIWQVIAEREGRACCYNANEKGQVNVSAMVMGTLTNARHSVGWSALRSNPGPL